MGARAGGVRGRELLRLHLYALIFFLMYDLRHMDIKAVRCYVVFS